MRSKVIFMVDRHYRSKVQRGTTAVDRGHFNSIKTNFDIKVIQYKSSWDYLLVVCKTRFKDYSWIRVNGFFSILSISLLFLPKHKIVLQWHHMELNSLQKLILKLLGVKKIRKVLFCTNHAHTEFVNVFGIGFNCDYRVIPHRISHVNYDPWVTKDIDLLFLGSLTKRKRPFDFLHLLEAIGSSIKVNAVMVGDGPLLKHLSRKAAFKKLTHEKQVSERDKWNLLRRSKLLIFPSNLEGFGIVLLEALSQGVLPVVYNVSCMPEVLRNYPHVLVEEEGNIDLMKDYVVDKLNSFNSEFFMNLTSLSWESVERDLVTFYTAQQ